MKTRADSVTTDGVIGFEDVLSDDGTRIRAWTNDPNNLITGPTVVLCNGLGTNATHFAQMEQPDVVPQHLLELPERVG